MQLERDLEEAHKRIIDLRADKASLESSVKELQTRLTQEQSRNGTSSSSNSSNSKSNHTNASSMAAALRDAQQRGEREKELQTLLIRTKTDKDKAIKVIINLIGKEKMSAFLNQHAGSTDILDAMVNTFGSDTLTASLATNAAAVEGSFGSSGTLKSPKSRYVCRYVW